MCCVRLNQHRVQCPARPSWVSDAGLSASGDSGLVHSGKPSAEMKRAVPGVKGSRVADAFDGPNGGPLVEEELEI